MELVNPLSSDTCVQKLRAALGRLRSFLSAFRRRKYQVCCSGSCVCPARSLLFPVAGPSEESWRLLSPRPGSGVSARMGGLAGLARAAYPATCPWQPCPPVRVQGHQGRMATGLCQEQKGSLGPGGRPGPALGLPGQPSSPQLPEGPAVSQTTVSSHLSPAAAGGPRTGSCLALLQQDGDTGEETVLTSCEIGCLERRSRSELPAPGRAPYRAPSVPYNPFFQPALCKQNKENLPSPRSPALRPGHDCFGHTLSSQEAGCLVCFVGNRSRVCRGRGMYTHRVPAGAELCYRLWPASPSATGGPCGESYHLGLLPGAVWEPG